MIYLSALPLPKPSSLSPSDGFSPSKHAPGPSQPHSIATSDPSSEPLTASLAGTKTSWALNSYPSYLPNNSHDIINPSPFPTSTSSTSSFSMSLSQQNNDTYSYGMTPTTATGQWSQSPAIDSALISSPLAKSIAFQNGPTGISPMFSAFNTTSIPNESFPTIAHPINPSRPILIRGHSASSAVHSPNRHRSSTLVTLSSPSPMTPSFNTYPYPSPHASYPSTPSYVSARNIFQQRSERALSENKRIFHPSPAVTAPGTGAKLTHLPYEHGHVGGSQFGSGNMLGGMGMSMEMDNRISLGMFPQMRAGFRTGNGQELKLPRFKPTKEQLEILIKSYEKNKNPDGPTREALAKKLGPDVRPKTLQIWFQNRRSKSRAKERDAANVPKLLQTNNPNIKPFAQEQEKGRNGSTGQTSGDWGEMKHGRVNTECLNSLILDDDPNLSILPITVLSIAKWTRFLNPGTGNIRPDLAASIRFPSTSTPSHPSPLLPTLHLYVLHTNIFRIDIPLSPSVVSSFQVANNPSVSTDAVAVRFELGRDKVRFACWIEKEGAGWKEVGDFTGGEAGSGGRVELTGLASVLLPAFSKVQQLLANTAYPTPISSFLISRPISIHPKPINIWRPPTNASDQSHSIPTSTPPSSSPLPNPTTTPPLPLSSVSVDTDMMSGSHQGQQATTPALAGHQRQRSLSQPIFPTSALIGGMMPVDPSLSSTTPIGQTTRASLTMLSSINTALQAGAQSSFVPSTVSFLGDSGHGQTPVTSSFDGSARVLGIKQLWESPGGFLDGPSHTLHINESELVEKSSTKMGAPASMPSSAEGQGIIKEKDP
ncbi:hypothetical protein AYX14_04566 [Cryptococcus neoformans]|nr:hypothetical protein AYX14_04566 [Cryptococcus neoformans var. grubii]